MHSWESHFRGMKPRKVETRQAGYGYSFGATPGDVLAYRTLWDDYVMGSIRGLNQCGDVLLKVAENPPQGYSADTIKNMGDTYHDLGSKYLASWNQFAGMSDTDILFSASTILGAFQSVVTDLGKLRENPNFATYCVSSMPNPPTVDAQKAVVAQLEGAGVIASGVLGIFSQSVTQGLQDVAKGAGTVVSSTAKGLFAGLGIPWYAWAGIGIVAIVVLPKVLSLTPLGLARRL